MEGTVTLLKSGLGKMGHVVFTARAGEQDLALLEDHPVDVIRNVMQADESRRHRATSLSKLRTEFPFSVLNSRAEAPTPF